MDSSRLAADDAAFEVGRTTLVLDTETHGEAAHLYRRWGWEGRPSA